MINSPVLGGFQEALFKDPYEHTISTTEYQPILGGGFKYFSFSSLFGEDSHFDKYFSDGLVQPPTRIVFLICVMSTEVEQSKVAEKSSKNQAATGIFGGRTPQCHVPRRK